MSDRTAVPERVRERAKTARRAGVLSGQPVGDYVGQPAGEAAQAVRRAGLRPGLDRSFGCAAELTGLVVAQDPVAGSELARNGMVTLYVAAPGSDLLDEEAAGLPATDEPPLSEQAEDAPSPPPSMPARRRRRKPGHGERTVLAKQTPSPAGVETSPAADWREQTTVELPAQWTDELEASDGAAQGEPGEAVDEREPAIDPLVAQAQDVLAGRGGPPAWRRAYPRRGTTRAERSGSRVRAWLGAHRLLAGALGVALGLWMLVGVAAMLSGHPRARIAGAAAPLRTPAARHQRSPAKPAPAPKAKTRKASTPARPARRRGRRWARPRRRASRAIRHPAPAPNPARTVAAPAVREAAAPAGAAAGPPPAAQPSQAPASQPSPPSPPAPEQSGGGLFSP